MVGQMCQKLRVLVALAEDSGSIPITYMAAHNHPQLQFQSIRCRVLTSHQRKQNIHTHEMWQKNQLSCSSGGLELINGSPASTVTGVCHRLSWVPVSRASTSGECGLDAMFLSPPLPSFPQLNSLSPNLHSDPCLVSSTLVPSQDPAASDLCPFAAQPCEQELAPHGSPLDTIPVSQGTVPKEGACIFSPSSFLSAGDRLWIRTRSEVTDWHLASVLAEVYLAVV